MTTSDNCLERLLGTRQVGGRLSLLRFGKIFCADTSGGAYWLTQVLWADDRIEAILTMADGVEVTVYLMRAGPGVDGPVVTRHLVLQHRGAELPAALSAGLDRAARTWLAKATLGRLAALLVDDPEFAPEALPATIEGDAFVGSDPVGDPTGDPEGDSYGVTGLPPGPPEEADASGGGAIDEDASKTAEVRPDDDAKLFPDRNMPEGGWDKAGPSDEERARRMSRGRGSGDGAGPGGSSGGGAFCKFPPPSGPMSAEDQARAETMYGQRKAGGRASIERFMVLLGFDIEPKTFDVASVAWIDDHVELDVVGADEAIRFRITKREPESRGLVITRELVVQYDSHDIPDPLIERVKRYGNARLPGYSMNALALAMLDDPELGTAGLALPSSTPDHPSNMVDTWAGPDAFCDFFAGGEIARCQLDSVDFGKFFRNVQHCDAECLLVNPHSQGEVVQMVDYPWEERARNIGAPLHEIVVADDRDWSDADSMVTTDLDEQDVIMGNDTKLREVLEYATTQPNPKNKPIFVANTCVPTVTGEDVESLVKEYREKTKVPLVYLTVTPKSMNDVFIDLFETRRLKAEKEAAPPVPRRVNLIGFAHTRAIRELVRLLERFDITINLLLLPDLEIDLIRRMPNASLNVFFPNSLWRHMYDQLKVDSRIPFVEPDAPFGWQNTREWVREICAALDDSIDFEPIWDAYAADYEEEWVELTSQLAEHRLGLVVRGEETHYVTDPTKTWGIPLLHLANEMGVGLDVFVSGLNERKARIGTEKINKALGSDHEHKVQDFDTFDTMRELLRASECSAVLTNHFFDWRVGEAGKNRFSLQHFEMGLPGALRTAERLLEICETPFYRNYARYLRRNMEGLRVFGQDEAAP